jgi:hypothetical protein
MNEIECARCGWNWIMFEGQTEADCPFCPVEPGGYVLVSPKGCSNLNQVVQYSELNILGEIE